MGDENSIQPDKRYRKNYIDQVKAFARKERKRAFGGSLIIGNLIDAVAGKDEIDTAHGPNKRK